MDHKYYQGALRLVNTVKKVELFDEIKIITEIDLQKDTIFWKKHGDFIEKNKHIGYGYWLWKPYIIKMCLAELNDGDILFYLDCDCLLHDNKQLISQYFDIIKTDYIIGSLTNIEKYWTKMDIIQYLDITDNKYLETEQRQGGTNMFYVCDQVNNLVDEWYKTACNYNLIDDSIIIKNIPSFKNNRHDQSIFSLLSKKHNLYSTRSLFDIITITSL
jgi:hypothetical protein